MTQDEALAWFNELSGKLEIQLSEPARRVSPRLANLAAPRTATITGLRLVLRAYDRPRDDPERYDHAPRELTDAEWARLVVLAPRMRLRNETGVVEHAAADRRGFTTRDLARAIEATERETRATGRWLGGIDVHHVFFEGMRLDSDGAWLVAWGS